MKGIVFIRNSDVSCDTRLRKAIYEAKNCGLVVHFYGWIRDGRNRAPREHKIGDKKIETNYFLLRARFGKGLKNIFQLIAFNIWLTKSLVVKRRSYEAIYACDLDVMIPAVIAKIFLQKKIYYDIFDFYAHTHALPRLLKKTVEKIEYQLCKLAESVIVCTEKRAQILKNKTGIEPIIIFNTPNLVLNKINIECDDSAELDKLKIVYVGTLPVKSRLLFEIAEKIKVSTNIELHIAGAGPLSNYFNEESKKFKNIIFYGQVSNEDALKLQSNADILFATYDPNIEINKNSAPNKVYEAMALGKPIIVCANTDADTVVTNNNCGIAIKYDSNEFIDVIHRYKNNKFLKELHGKNGNKLYESIYSWSICREKLQKIFTSI